MALIALFCFAVPSMLLLGLGIIYRLYTCCNCNDTIHSIMSYALTHIYIYKCIFDM